MSGYLQQSCARQKAKKDTAKKKRSMPSIIVELEELNLWCFLPAFSDKTNILEMNVMFFKNVAYIFLHLCINQFLLTSVIVAHDVVLNALARGRRPFDLCQKRGDIFSQALRPPPPPPPLPPGTTTTLTGTSSWTGRRFNGQRSMRCWSASLVNDHICS